MANAKTNEAKLLALSQTIFELCDRLGHNDLSEKLAQAFGEIDIKASGALDGRATSWTDDRRKAVGERVAKAWEAKRQARGTEHKLYRYQFSDVKPELLDGLDAIAKRSSLTVRTIQNKLSTNSDGFIIREGRFQIFYARDDEALDRLRHAQFHLTHNSEDIVELPSKKNKSF